jgi:hypothetical protein
VTENSRFSYRGNFTNSQFGGDGAQFNQNNASSEALSDTEQLRAAITQLSTLIQAHADQIENPERARRDADEIFAEAERPSDERDPSRISDALQRLRTRLEPIAGITESIEKIVEPLGRLLAG